MLIRAGIKLCSPIKFGTLQQVKSRATAFQLGPNDPVIETTLTQLQFHILQFGNNIDLKTSQVDGGVKRHQHADVVSG